MNELNDVLGKRLRGMAVRILACIEHTVKADLDGIEDNEKFTIMGGDLKVIRSEVLNAAGDTTRSLGSLLEQPISGKRTISREMMNALSTSKFEIVEFEDEMVPLFSFRADYPILCSFQRQSLAGLVYDGTYTCVGVDDIVRFILPFLDSAILAGARLDRIQFQTWRKQVAKLYLGEE